MKNFLLLIFLSFINIFFTKEEVCSYTVHCKKDQSNNICVTKKKTDSPNIYDIEVNPCEYSSCNVHDALLGERESTKFCKNSTEVPLLTRPSYPGGSCSSDMDCLSGVCLQDKCQDSGPAGSCISHENCPLNMACINDMCRAYIQDGENCTDSYQCKFGSFCYKKSTDKSGKCTELFSFEDGKEIDISLTGNEKLENICKSGGYYVHNDGEKNHYFCETLINNNFSCKNKCTYTKNSTNSTFESEERCLCGFNRYRSKYCVLGNGQPEYISYLENKKDFLNKTYYINKCHTLERDSDEICNELINSNKTVAFRNYVQVYNNKKILALQYHRIQESEDCVKEAVFGYKTSPIIPVKQSCPKFSCNTDMENCLFGNNPLNENGNNISLQLNPKICRQNEYCTTSGISTVNDIMLIMKKQTIEGQCSIYQKVTGVRYPGEECNINSDCVENSLCENGECTGIKEGESCNKTSECKKGYFCYMGTKTCQKQKKEGEMCSEGWDCANFLGCYSGRCILFGSLKAGIRNTIQYSPFPGNEKRYYLCNTGELDGDDGTTGDFCVQTDYSEIWLNETGKIVDENGFVKCDYNETCKYFNGKRNITKICGCGYNSDGQGYCPLPSARRMEEWNKRIKYIGESAGNKCHSLSRFNCYLQNDYKEYVQRREMDKNTIEAHLFYNAVPCAETFFVGQEFIKTNLFFILLLIALFY